MGSLSPRHHLVSPGFKFLIYQGLVNMFYESEHNKYSRHCIQKAKLTQSASMYMTRVKNHMICFINKIWNIIKSTFWQYRVTDKQHKNNTLISQSQRQSLSSYRMQIFHVKPFFVPQSNTWDEQFLISWPKTQGWSTGWLLRAHTSQRYDGSVLLCQQCTLDLHSSVR